MIAFSCVAVLLLIVIGLLLWRLRRVLTRKANTSDNYICDKGERHDTSRDEHFSEPGPYTELKPRTLDGQSRAAPEYQELQSKKETPGYYNLGVNRRRRSADEQVYEQMGTAESRAAPEYQELPSKKETPGYYNLSVISRETTADHQMYE